jgi:type VI secretion system secreted protein Hcp
MAYEFYVTVEGVKFGKFSEETSLTAGKGKIAGLAFHYTIQSPRDVATGHASGKRQHQPISFVKEWGAATPQFFQAAVSNEVLKSVLFEFVNINNNGEEYIFHTIKLTNANVSEIEQYIELDDDQPPATRPLEKISLTFQKIEIENKDGKTTAADDWRGRL